MPVGIITTITPPTSGGATPQGDIKTLFFSGLSERGDTTAPILARSFAEFIDLTGARVTYGSAYDQAQAFFAEADGAPARLYFARDVGGSATKGTLNLLNGASTAVVRLDAKDPGAWSANLTAEVQAGLVAGTTTLLLTYNGTLVEKYANLADPAAYQTALASSAYVRATDLGVGTDPAVLAATPLSAGNDDRGATSASTLVTALARFPADLGPGIVAIPGQAASAVAAGLEAHAAANGRTTLTSVALGTSVSSAATTQRGLRATTGAERLGLAYPWVQIPDGAGGTRLISPEGAVAGRRAATIDAYGPWRAPAGEQGRFRFVTGLERNLTAAEINTISDDAGIPLKLAADGPRIYGWRSLSADEVNYRTLSVMDTLNDVAYGLSGDMEEFEFGTVDGAGQVLTRVKNKLLRRLGPIAAAGGFYAGPDDPGYKVDVGPTINTLTTLQRGELRAAVEVRVSPVIELFRIFLTRVPLTSDL